MKRAVSACLLLSLLGGPNATCAQSPPAYVTNSLVAFYPFNGNANDATGGGNDGIPVGAQISTNRFGEANTAYKFNGVNNTMLFLSVPLSAVNNWTIAAWINPASLNQTGVPLSVGFDNLSSGNGYAFGVANKFAQPDQPGAKLIGLLDGVTTIETSYSFPTASRWYHVVMSRGAGTTRLFVDGVMLAQTSSSEPQIPTDFRVGSQNGIRYFNGLVDDVRIYNRSLSEAEVVLLYRYEWPDSDDDGLADAEEINIYHTDPLKKDTDADGIPDKQEVHVHMTNPLLADSDGDGYNDLTELESGHNPLNTLDRPAAALKALTAIELEFPTQLNTQYMIQASPDLITWTNYHGPVVGNGNVVTNLFSIRGAGKLFFRVELAQ